MQRAAPRARRYISEDFSGSALHPIDVLDAGSGRQLAQLVDANLVRALHQSLCQGQNGSRASKSLFLPRSREVLMRCGQSRRPAHAGLHMQRVLVS